MCLETKHNKYIQCLSPGCSLCCTNRSHVYRCARDGPLRELINFEVLISKLYTVGLSGLPLRVMFLRHAQCSKLPSCLKSPQLLWADAASRCYNPRLYLHSPQKWLGLFFFSPTAWLWKSSLCTLTDRWHYVNSPAGSKQQQILRRADGMSKTAQLGPPDWALRQLHFLQETLFFFTLT